MADKIIPYLNFGISLFSITLAFLGFRYYLKRTARGKQLEVVLDLIKQIHADFNTMSFKNTTVVATLFDIAEMEDFEHKQNVYFLEVDPYDIMEGNIYKRWDFYLKFYTNPLLPRSIADVLNKFNINNAQTIAYSQTNSDKDVYIGSPGTIDKDTRCLFHACTDMEKAADFKNAAKALKLAIVTWLNKYGVNDVNITTSHHFVKKTVS